MNKLLKSLLVAGVLSTAAIAAFSQAGHGMMEHGMMDHGGKPGMRHMDPAKMDQMVSKHLAELKAKLKITAAQESAWTTFTTAMKPSGDMMAMGQRPDMAEMAKLPMPERMDKMRALRKEHMEAMEASMDKLENAAKALYAVLSPEQQKVADAEHARMMGGHHGMNDRKGAGANSAKPATPAKP